MDVTMGQRLWLLALRLALSNALLQDARPALTRQDFFLVLFSVIDGGLLKLQTILFVYC